MEEVIDNNERGAVSPETPVPAVTTSDLPEASVPPLEPEVEAPAAVVDSSAPATVAETYYNGQVVVERTETVTADGRLCKLADGSTAYVPLSILGEE